MGKYQSLADHLDRLKRDSWRATFAELEAVLGFELPKGARQNEGWWANEWSSGKPNKRAWLDRGWKTEDLDLAGERVTFRRTALPPASEGDAATPAAMQRAAAAYDQRRKARTIGVAALGGGGVAALVIGAALAGFLFGRYSRRW